nr:unnamed protein product [Digitaria exilis]
MDFHALSRRELQALCKRNAVRANMSNAAMADALRSLPSVDGLDEIGRAGAPPMKSVEEVIMDEEKIDGNPLPRGGRARSKARTAAKDKLEQDVGDQATLQGIQGTAAREALAPLNVAEVTREEQGHGCPLPRGRCVGAMTRKAAAHKTEEAVLAPDTFQGSQRTEAGEGPAPVEAEEVATGKRRTTRCTRSKAKMALDQKEATECKEQKGDSSDVATGSVVVSEKSIDGPKTHEVVEEDVMKGQPVDEMDEVPATAILRRSQRTLAPVEAKEVAMAKKMARRSTRSKVAAAKQKGQKADSSVMTNGSADNKSIDCPKKDEVVAVVEEETTKPHDGGNVTRRITAHEMEEVPVPATSQQSQGMAALEAAVPVEAEKGATTKRRRRPRRSKAAAAARNGQNADSSDVAIGSPVLAPDQSCDDLREDQLIAVEEHVTKPQEGIVEEQDQSSSIHKSASSVKMEDPPTVSNLSCVNYMATAADEETVKKDCFTLNSGAGQLDFLVNTLNRFSKPMHEFTIKEEKKEGECWWMLV